MTIQKQIAGLLMMNFMDDFIDNQIHSVEECITHLNRFTQTNLNYVIVLLVQEEEDNEGKKAIGCVSLQTERNKQTEFPFTYVPQLGNLCIDPQYRNQGLGMKLIELINYICKEYLHQPILYAWCYEPLLSYYTSNGWEIETQHDEEDCKGMVRFILKKNIV